MNKRSLVEQMVAPDTWITLLLSPLASFLTGAVIPLDGGQVIDRE